MRVSITTAVDVTAPREEHLARCAELHRRPDRLDDLCLAGLAAASAALADAAGRVDAIVLGTALGCTEADMAYYAQLLDRGLKRTNPRLFAYTLPNVVIGEVAIALRIDGENLCITTGRASGLTALGEAAGWIESRAARRVLTLVLDVVGPASERLYAGRTPAVPRALAFVLEAGTTGVAVIEDYACWFEGSGGTAMPIDADPLSSAGLELPLRGERIVTCTSGHCARIRFGATQE